MKTLQPCDCCIVLRNGETLTSRYGATPCSEVSRIILCPLHAAAPAMYAESKTLCSLVRAFMNDNRLYDGQLIQAIHNLETALAQAEGK